MDPDAALVLFAGAPPGTCSRITKLELCSTGTADEMSAAALSGILRSVPQLQELDLCPALADSSLARALASVAFSQMRQLTQLSLEDFAWLLCLGDRLAAQITSLNVSSHCLARGAVARDLPGLVSGMTALRSLTLRTAMDDQLTTSNARQLVDAVPPSLEHMELYRLPLGTDLDVTVYCGFSGGLLTSFHVDDAMSDEGVTHAGLSAFLAAVLLPSPKLGPRLGLLHLELPLLVDGAPPPSPDPATGLYGRCDAIKLWKVTCNAEGRPDDVLAAVQRFGQPQLLSHYATGQYGVALQLSTRPAEAASAMPPAQLPPVPRPATVVARAVERMAAAAAADPGFRHSSTAILLRGSSVRPLLAVPTALHVWVAQLAAETAARAPAPAPAQGSRSSRRSRLHSYLPLPITRAVVLYCGGGEAAEARAFAQVAVDAALRLAAPGDEEEAGGGGRGAGEGSTGLLGLEVLPTQLFLLPAMAEVLQSLWADVQGRGSERERLAWLLEAWEGLRGMPETIDLYPHEG
ncbi:hypothetical protein HYH03_010089 [Edaphochlamys debaryana]|uniref:Uncharacterized protein n=1 Tax=Edaphochlamys debaryana TaxID=47281 RepID=A0A835XXM1_9CHLO|nr:hypothetical protein HYH03_010089 [Edaphochlamys debaryana]|eukprot:KAG2491512.1 hypothetical protein HYH03_010089 [Edaphochlamys debaryana]